MINSVVLFLIEIGFVFPHVEKQVAKQFTVLTKETPMFTCIGLMPSADRPSNTVCSYMSVHDDLGAKSKSYAAKYQQFVLDYAVEWEKIISTRIDAGIKKAELLRIELDHYQKKYEALRLTANQSMAKGKSVPSGHQEKLARNEEKLLSSKQTYNKVATDLCILMEEVTERSWRDLHPLLIKVAQFDMTLANDESKALAALAQVVTALKQVATDNGLSPQPRLKDWAGLKPELLSTRPGGVAGLQIEAGPAFAISSEMALPPGSVGPQGMGGFPVQIASPSNDPYAPPRTMSASSVHSAPDAFGASPDPLSSFNMLTIQSTAPAPTLDDVYGRYPNSTHSAPPTGNFTFPALPASTTPSSWDYRSSSFNDADSAYSGFSAPASAPPLPPSMPPPPPPPMAPSYGAPPPPAAYGMSSMPQPPAYGGGGGAHAWPPPPQQAPMRSMSAPAVNPLALYGAPPPATTPNSNPHYNPFG
jgi:hypothetical protein